MTCRFFPLLAMDDGFKGVNLLILVEKCNGGIILSKVQILLGLDYFSCGLHLDGEAVQICYLE